MCLLIVVALPLIYVVSVGPATPLMMNSGERGYLLWQAVYFEPLRKLPRPCRNVINKYIGFCGSIHMKWKVSRMQREASRSSPEHDDGE